MPVQLQPDHDVVRDFSEGSLSICSNTSGTASYGPLRVANTHGRTCVRQKEEKKYYKKKALEEGVRLVAEEPWKPFVLDVVGLEQVAAAQAAGAKKERTGQLKREYRSQEYKRTAFRLMDEYFKRPGGQVFRLSGNTKKGKMTVQLVGAEAVRRDGRLDDEAVERELRLEKTVDELAVRRARLDELKKNGGGRR